MIKILPILILSVFLIISTTKTATTPKSTSTKSILLNNSGNFIVSGSADNTLKLWDANTNSLKLSFCLDDGTPFESLFYNDELLLSCVSYHAYTILKVFNVSSGLLVQNLNASCWRMNKLFNGDLLLGDSIAKYNISIKKFVIKLQFLGTGLFSFQLKSGYIFSGSWYDISLFNPNNGSLVYKQNLFGALVGEEVSSNKVVVGFWDYSLGIWQIINNEFKKLFTLNGHNGPVTTLQLLNKNLIASSSSYAHTSNGYLGGDNRIFIWDFVNGTNVKILNGHNRYVNNMIKINDSILASSDYETKIKLWDLKTFNLKYTLNFSNNTENHGQSYLNVLKNGNLISATNTESYIKIWNVETGTLKLNLELHDKAVCSLLKKRNNGDFNMN